MSVKPSYALSAMRFVSRLSIAVVCVSSLAACASLGMSSPGSLWREFTGDREPQAIGGPKRLPQNQTTLQSETGEAPLVTYDSGYAPAPASAPSSVHYETYVPVEAPESENRTSQPVILKHENATDPYDSYNNGNNPEAPAPSVEPSVFDNITGWFSSGVTPGSDERTITTFAPVANVESVLVQGAANANNEAVMPVRKPIRGNYVREVTAPDPATYAMTPVQVQPRGDASETPPLSSVPKNPPRLYQALKDRSKNEWSLREMHKASDTLRANLEEQRANEAAGSLLLPENTAMATPPVDAESAAEPKL